MVITKPSQENYFSPRKVQMRKVQIRVLQLSEAKISKLAKRHNICLHRYVMLMNLQNRVQLDLVKNRLEDIEALVNDSPSR